MNVQRIQEIFNHYISIFDVINNEEHHETYKWVVAKQYHILMDKALAIDGPEFADALYKVCVCTENIIDSYTQPFYGLVRLARQEPEIVRKMFLDLYAGDGGDLHVQEQLISDFFDKSNELLDKYFPGSHLYKQNSHSVSAYLLLYDPDHHYMYKATQSRDFADYIEFYDDWGTGDNIKLDIYYRMCDWVVEQILQSPDLLTVNESRFNFLESEKMHPDMNKHILCFDLIYCSSVYDVYGDVKFERPSSAERKQIAEKKQEADILMADYNKAIDAQHKLDEAMYIIKTQLTPGTEITHKRFGMGEILSCDEAGNAEVSFATSGSKKLNLPTVFGNGIAGTEIGWAEKALAEYVAYLKDEKHIRQRVEYTEHMLEPYRGYID